MPLALAEAARQKSVDNLNQLLAETLTLRDLYKKHHWQVSGTTFYQLRLLFEKHAATHQGALIDTIAERIMTLGGISVVMAQEVAEYTTIPQPPMDREYPKAVHSLSTLRAPNSEIEESCRACLFQNKD